MENATQPVPLIELRDIRKRYGGNGTPEVEVLKGVSLSIHAGEFVAIVGASGSGKSTLMNILGCLDRPSSGSYHFAGHDVAELDSDEQAWLRREAFGFVFQGYHLIPSASAQENVEMPAIYAGTPASERHTRARALLKRLGLAERTANRPHQLSGGQQQRVSIARALMNGGHIILADEPTGALDSHSGAEVMALLDELASQGHVVILITHDRDVAARAKRIIEVRDGEIVSDSANDERPAHPSAGVERHLQADDLSQRLAEGSSEPSGAWRAELLEAVRAAWRVMWINRFRTALTLLGIIIGVASVVVMLAVGEGSKRQVMAQMGAFGSNIIYLSGYSPNPRAPMGIVSSDDVAAIATLPQVKKVMPVNGGEPGGALRQHRLPRLRRRQQHRLPGNPQLAGGRGQLLHRARRRRRHHGRGDRLQGAQEAVRQRQPDRPLHPHRERAVPGHRRARRERLQAPATRMPTTASPSPTPLPASACSARATPST